MKKYVAYKLTLHEPDITTLNLFAFPSPNPSNSLHSPSVLFINRFYFFCYDRLELYNIQIARSRERIVKVTGVELIAKERQRQIEEEGFTAGHDDNYPSNALAYAALCYLVPDAPETVMTWWPWSWDWWKPRDRLSNLVRAGALIAAEIDRLKRQEGSNQ